MLPVEPGRAAGFGFKVLHLQTDLLDEIGPLDIVGAKNLREIFGQFAVVPYALFFMSFGRNLSASRGWAWMRAE
jgi:hypothetical protein